MQIEPTINYTLYLYPTRISRDARAKTLVENKIYTNKFCPVKSLYLFFLFWKSSSLLPSHQNLNLLTSLQIQSRNMCTLLMVFWFQTN